MKNQEIIVEDFRNENYQSVIDNLKQNINNNIAPVISSIELIYVHWYIVLEVRKFPYNGKDLNEWGRELKHVYKTYSSPWMNDADFLFYTAYMGSSFCEAFIGLDRKDVYDMFGKAYEMHPDNILYQWGEFNRKFLEYKEQGKELEWKGKNKRMAQLVLANGECVKAIKKYPLLGKDLLWLLDIQQKEEF